MPDTLFINDKKQEVADLFESMGGQFILPPMELAQKLKKVKCFIFDWDGVFNDGRKGAEKTSDFAEADTMALHIIRFAYWKLTGKLPVMAIITGQDNQTAYKLAEREHLAAVFAGYKDKFEPIEILKKEYSLKNNELAAVFDDIIDYPLAKSAALRFLIRRDSSPLYLNYFKKNELCDYITYSRHPEFPVREIGELIVGMYGIYDEMLISRFRDKDKYLKFWNLRQSVETRIFKNEGTL